MFCMLKDDNIMINKFDLSLLIKRLNIYTAVASYVCCCINDLSSHQTPATYYINLYKIFL